MTRDEAYKISRRFWGDGAMEAVDIWRELGMLKLDEPKSVKERLQGAYCGFASLTPSGLLAQLDRVGLKIVEK